MLDLIKKYKKEDLQNIHRLKELNHKISLQNNKVKYMKVFQIPQEKDLIVLKANNILKICYILKKLYKSFNKSKIKCKCNNFNNFNKK